MSRDKWWVREIERINRAHAAQVAELVATVSHLAGRPLPADRQPEPFVAPEPRATVRNPEQYPDAYDLAEIA